MHNFNTLTIIAVLSDLYILVVIKSWHKGAVALCQFGYETFARVLIP